MFTNEIINRRGQSRTLTDESFDALGSFDAFGILASETPAGS